MMASDLVSLPLLGPATLPGRRAAPKEILTMRIEYASLSLGACSPMRVPVPSPPSPWARVSRPGPSQGKGDPTKPPSPLRPRTPIRGLVPFEGVPCGRCSRGGGHDDHCFPGIAVIESRAPGYEGRSPRGWGWPPTNCLLVPPFVERAGKDGGWPRFRTRAMTCVRWASAAFRGQRSCGDSGSKSSIGVVFPGALAAERVSE